MSIKGIKNTKLYTDIKEYIIMTLAVMVYSLTWECFMVPNEMASGGMTGLCTIIQYATDGAIPVSLSYGVINVVLLLVAFAVMGASFGVRTIYCIALSTVMFEVFGSMEFLHATPGHFFFVQEKFLIPVIAGILEGIALGVVFRMGGSTGGTDIIALFVNKYWPVSPGKVFLYCDLVIISAILLLPGRHFADMIYGYLMMIGSTAMVDYVMVGKKSSVQLLVFSDNYEEIADYIINVLDRGVTVLRAQGWFTKAEKDVLLIISSRNQLHEITRIVKEMDPKAFVSVTQTHSVYGEGFEEIKTGLDRKKNKALYEDVSEKQ